MARGSFFPGFSWQTDRHFYLISGKKQISGGGEWPQGLRVILPREIQVEQHRRCIIRYIYLPRQCRHNRSTLETDNAMHTGRRGWVETVASSETRHKEHMADVKHRRRDNSTLTRHVLDLGHSMDWQQSKVSEFDCDFHKCRFRESYYINTDWSSMSDKSSDMFQDILVQRFFINQWWRLLLYSFHNLPTISIVPSLVHCFVSASIYRILTSFRGDFSSR